MSFKNIIFDFGGVLIDWNPRYVYREYFDSEMEMENFLGNICTNEWNLEQDRGRLMSEGTKILQNQYPEYHDLISVFYDRWEEMLKSDIPENVELLYSLKSKYKLFGLTNWSAETISVAHRKYPFLAEFQGIVVSGEEKLVKHDRRIFELILDRYKLDPVETVFIDDNTLNIEVANQLGLTSVHCDSPEGLKERLLNLNII